MSDFDKKEYAPRDVLNIRMENIKTIACKFYKVSHDDFHCRSRKGNIPSARFLFYYMCDKFFKRYLTQAEMGAWVGGYDHATARHGIQTFKNMLDIDKKLNKDVIDICADFREMYSLDASIDNDREKTLENRIREQRSEISALYKVCLEMIDLHVPLSAKSDAKEMITSKMTVNTLINVEKQT